MHFSLEQINQLEKRYRTQLINSFTGFKSLTLIGTQSADGLTNLSVFSQVFHVGANPPYIGVLFRPHTVKRDTFENIISTGKFTINHVKEEFVEKAHNTSARWEVSEFEATGLTPEYLHGFHAPFVKESVIKCACELNERIDIKSNGTHLVIGEMVHLEAPDNSIQKDGWIDLESSGSLTVSGLDSYHKTTQISRLPYAKPTKVAMTADE